MYLDNIYVLTGQSISEWRPTAIQRSLTNLFELMTDKSYEHTDKGRRWFFSQSSKDIRPTLQTSYKTWSGVLAIDLDVKNGIAAKEVKQKLSLLLRKQPWFVAAVLSASHNGVHIYTACKPDIALMTPEVYLDHIESISIIVWQTLNLAYKMAVAENKLQKIDLLDMHPVYNMSSRKELKNGSLSESKLFDLATFKLTQPTIIAYDPEPYINADFVLEPPLGFDIDKSYAMTSECGVLKQMFDKRRGRDQVYTENKIIQANMPVLDTVVPRSYDNTARYRLAYTIANVYDIASKNNPAYSLLKQCFLRMCSGNPKFRREQHAFESAFDSAVQRQAVGLCPKIAWAIHELKVVHRFPIETEELTVEQKQQIYDVDINLELSKPIVIPPELQITYDVIYKLESGQYIANATDILLSKLSKPKDKLLLIAEPGTGKTVFATNLMQNTQLRVLCIVPYISVIESKFKTLSPEANCQCCYGYASYDVTLSRNAVMTFDKFSKMSMADLDACFDIIVLDESHLLQMSAYRSLVPAECIDRLRLTKTPTVLMTGTPIAEHMFIDFTFKTKFIRQRTTEKLFNIVVCNNPAEKFVQAVLHISNALKSGRKVIMPTNEGNSYVEKISAAVKEQIGREVIWEYYKKEFAEQTFMYEVNRNQTLGEIELLFCSAYLSVGVDINDFDKFDIVYTEDFSAHEIEQFNNRLRKVDLASYYFIAKYKNDATAWQNCFNNVMPNLRMSKIRQLELADLLSLQTIYADDDAQAMQLSKLYDYVTRKLRKPWLIQLPTGKVQLHATCYALSAFEDSWRKWSVQVPVLVQQLRQYNYQISVINTELLDNDEASNILESARQGLRDYKDKINDDLMFIIDKMQNKDFYDIMTYSNVVRLQMRQGRGLQSNGDVIDLFVQNVPQCHRFIKSVRMLSKYYTRTTVLSLYNGASTLAKFEQVFQTVELLDYAANDRLSTANINALRYVLHTMFERQRSIKMSKIQYLHHIEQLRNIYQAVYKLQSQSIIDKINVYIDSLIKRLAWKTTNMRGDTVKNIWELKTIPAFDSSSQLNLETQKTLIYDMFKASIFTTNTEKTSSDVHDFFTASSTIVNDQVDLMQSINKVQSMQTLPTFSKTDLRKAKEHIQLRRPNWTDYDVSKLMSYLDVNKAMNILRQADKLLEQQKDHYEYKD